MHQIGFILLAGLTSKCFAGISPFHDFQSKYKPKADDDRFSISSPHRVVNHLDSTILKSTHNVTKNDKMDETLYHISKDLVSSILSILEIQDKITRITKEALDAAGTNKRITAIETRRILDYISRTLSNNILSITKDSTEYELHHLVYGLAQIATETSIIAALKDTTFATVISKKQTIDLSLRKKRSIDEIQVQQDDQLIKESKVNMDEIPSTTITSSSTTENSVIYNAILNKANSEIVNNSEVTLHIKPSIPIPDTPFSVISKPHRSMVHVVNTIPTKSFSKSFLNKTALDLENNQTQRQNDTSAIVLDKGINLNKSHYTLDTFEPNAPGLLDEWVDNGDSPHKINTDIEMEMDQDDISEDKNDKKTKLKLERLESKSKKAILYAGDVAYLAAASVVAMRRALTASTEVQMSVILAKNSMSNHQDLMMNLAKTAAQQVGKEAKIATSKSLACERMLKLAIKYTAQSNGAILNHVANRIVMNTLSLSTLAKSMAFVSSDIAINSLYLATDVKPPS